MKLCEHHDNIKNQNNINLLIVIVYTKTLTHALVDSKWTILEDLQPW